MAKFSEHDPCFLRVSRVFLNNPRLLEPTRGDPHGQGDHHTPKPYVRQAFRKYLECGIFAHGFARVDFTRFRRYISNFRNRTFVTVDNWPRAAIDDITVANLAELNALKLPSVEAVS